MEFVTFEGLTRRRLYAANRRRRRRRGVGRSVVEVFPDGIIFFSETHAICRQKSRSTATLLSWVAPQRHLTLRFVAKVELFFVVSLTSKLRIESHLHFIPVF